MNNETHEYASRQSNISTLVAIVGVFDPFLAFMGSNKCPKGVYEVHSSYFYTAAIFTQNISHTRRRNSCCATAPASFHLKRSKGSQDTYICMFERLGLNPNVLVPVPTQKYHVGLMSAPFQEFSCRLDKQDYQKLPVLAKNNPISAAAQIAMDSHCESRLYVPAIFYYVRLYCLIYTDLTQIFERTNQRYDGTKHTI